MDTLDSLPRMPPLSALRAFESAARHGSFTLAAQELKLTHGAIGSQVRALEESMGVRFFDRIGRGLALTTEGRTFAERVRAALLDIVAAASEIKQSLDGSKLTLSVLPSFASRWLVPRIGRFIAQNPKLELVVHTTTEVVDFKRQTVDLCIRFGVGPWENLWCERFLQDSYYPVCSPEFLRAARLEQPDDIRAYPLLSCIDEPWAPWFRAAGLMHREEPRGVTYSDAVNLLQAAKGGQGIALARHTLVTEDIRSGHLIRLFDIGIPCPMSYYLVCTPALAESAKVRRFRAWLWSEIDARAQVAVARQSA
jgi:LysR family glycine cleavage system transcriptional activator